MIGAETFAQEHPHTYQTVLYLLKRGMDDTEIAKRLSMYQHEVRAIREETQKEKTNANSTTKR